MHFDLKTINVNHAYGLFIGLVAPRPIALVTTCDTEGRLNAAPFSAFNYLSLDPAIVALGVANRPGREASPKDTARNIRSTREFVINVVTEDIAEAMNICAIDFPPDVNELEMAGLSTEASCLVSGAAHQRGSRRARMPGVHDRGDRPIEDHPRRSRWGICGRSLHRPQWGGRCGSAPCDRQDERAGQLRTDERAPS